jgi:co-chaperonin GroES (HSP10)
MDLRPVAGKVLIQPDPTERTTEAGLVLVEHWPMEVSGVVVAVGHSKHPRKDEAFALADTIRELFGTYSLDSDCPNPQCLLDAARLLRELTGREPEVNVGDRVLFGLSAGQEVRIEDTRYFLMNETDLLAVIPPDTEVAA